MTEQPALYVSKNPLAKVGAWVFCEFELSQVKEVDGDLIKAITDGTMFHSSYDLSDRCFPLEMDVKRISDLWEWESRKLHAEGGAGLNFPEIHRYLVETWADTCRFRFDEKVTEANVKTFREWINETWQKIRERKTETVNGVRLFGR